MNLWLSGQGKLQKVVQGKLQKVVQGRLQKVVQHGFDSSRVLKLSFAPWPFFVTLSTDN